MKSKLKKLALASLVVMLGIAGGVAGANLAQEETPTPEQAEASRQAIAAQPRETEYVPLNPCRIADTRSTTPIAPNTSRTFDARGDLSAQGGSASGCGIPTNARALAVNITAVDPAGTGYLRGAAAFSSLPNATLLNYSTALNASNGVNLPICVNFPNGLLQILCGDNHFKLGAFTNATDVVVDVTGYFALPIFVNVDGDSNTAGNGISNGDNARLRNVSGFTSVVLTSTGNYTLNSSIDLRGCAIQATASVTDSSDGASSAIASVHGISSTQVLVDVRNSAGTLINDEFAVTAEC